MAGLIAEKIGMTQVKNEQGHIIPATLLRVSTHKVLQVKNMEKDNVDAVVVGAKYSESKKKYSQVKQFALTEGKASEKDQEYGVDILDGVEEIRISALSKGKGFQGGIKRHNFKGGRGSHGAKYVRAIGSIGTRKPRRTHKGRKMPGHMGSDVITLQGVPVLDLDKNHSLVVVKGPVPGSYGTIVYISF